MPTSNGGHHGSNGHGHGGGPLPPDGMYHVSDSINGINDGIGEKVNSDEGLGGDGGRNSGSGSSDEAAAPAGVGLYRRLPSSTCV